MSEATPIRRSPVPQRNASVVLVGLLAVSGVGASAQSAQLEDALQELEVYYAAPTYYRTHDRQQARFQQLAREWRKDTQWLSSTTEIAMHPAFQTIIGMGREALPLILRELRDRSGHWFWALKAISGEDPVLPSDRGSVTKMREAWVRWGEEKGFIAQ